MGVKQGCPLSPLLFGPYIDGLEVSMRGCGDPTLRGVGVPLLAFADDVLLLSTDPEGLQRKLALLEKFSEESGLSVNLQKTQIVVFGGQFSSQRRKHNFSYGGEVVEIVQSYRYLGVQFVATAMLSKPFNIWRKRGGRQVLQWTKGVPSWGCGRQARESVCLIFWSVQSLRTGRKSGGRATVRSGGGVARGTAQRGFIGRSYQVCSGFESQRCQRPF